MTKYNYQPVEYFNDLVGVAVKAGDTIAYAVSSGNMAELKMGTVQGIFKDEEALWWRQWDIVVKAEGSRRPSHLSFPNRIIRVRTALEVQLAERRAEVEAHPVRITFGGQASYDE